MRYEFVDRHHDRWKISRMCGLLNLSRSGFYAWRRSPLSLRETGNEELIVQIREIYEEGKGEYGSPTICQTLREKGFMVNHKRIARLMRGIGIRAKVRRRFKHTTVRCKDHDASPNLLNQNFHIDKPNRVWISDITYIDTAEGWLYLTTIEDMCTRRIVGHAITDNLRATAVMDALRMALSRRVIIPGLIFHSDRGKQYIDHDFREILKKNGIIQSMSSTGNCYDNAMAESFFATLKKGHLFRERFQTKEEARRKLFEYLELFYNRVRRHSALGYKSPVAFEIELSTLA
ncbi:MAG: IS3 family transposase [Thaumarchaeota archaeon]|nr:IS3 family transposase [Nitrososphaerota archaeon]